MNHFPMITSLRTRALRAQTSPIASTMPMIGTEVG